LFDPLLADAISFGDAAQFFTGYISGSNRLSALDGLGEIPSRDVPSGCWRMSLDEPGGQLGDNHWWEIAYISFRPLDRRCQKVGHGWPFGVVDLASVILMPT
jgi:hypothetical protein